MSTDNGIGRISGGVGNVFTDAQGPININYFQEKFRRPRDPRTLNADLLKWLHRRFVPPDEYPEAAAMLRESRLVVVHGARGVGRRTTALMLLRGEDSAPSGFRELPNHPTEEEERLDSISVEPDDRLLLDLTDTPNEVVEGLCGDLDSLWAKVQSTTEARLVVAISTEQRDLLGPLTPWFSPITRPDGRRAFLQHLAAEEITPTSTDLSAQRVDRHLALEPMATIASLATLVRDARNADHDGSFSTWLDAAFAAITEHSGAVADQVKANRDGGFRALLVTTAFFERSSADVVFAADRELQSVLELPAAEVHALEGADLGERLADIGATVDDENRVGFVKLAYDAAVRTHFWRNFPDLRPRFRQWIGEAVRLGRRPDEADRLVDHFAEQCLRTGDHRDLLRLAEHWTSGPHAPAAARQALVRGLEDRKVGWQFRRQIYDWSRNHALSPGLAHVLVPVCAEELMSTRPEQALVRLNHLTRNRDESVARSAADALVRLAQNDNRFFRRLLARVAGDPRDHDVFLRLVSPSRLVEPHRGARPLIANADVRTALVGGWTSVLATEPRQRFAEFAVAWLADDRLLVPLVDACDDRPSAFNALHLIARDWARAAPNAEEGVHREHVLHRLHRAIDTAFGLTNEETLR